MNKLDGLQFCYPNGRKKALIMSYDDGTVHDRRFVSILNRYGIKGTFHLNSGLLGKPGYVSETEVAGLYAGHEVSAHTVTHPFLTQHPAERVVMEVMQDRANLEALAGYPVDGMSYPYGDYDDRLPGLLRAIGVRYCRTVDSHGGFGLPRDYLRWHPTCFHLDDLAGYAENYSRLGSEKLSLFHVWGHSYEFEREGLWETIESFCARLGGDPAVWSCTMMEYYDYMQALDRLHVSVSGGSVRNPSAAAVWLGAGGRAVEIPGGSVVRLT